MLRPRLIVAAVGLPALAGLLLLPERWFSAAVTLILAAAAVEFVRATIPGAGRAALLGAAAATALLAASARTPDGPPLWTLLPALALALAGVLRPGGGRALRWPHGAWWVTGVLYVGALGGHLLLLRIEPQGARWLALALAATFATDTGAYAVGRALGRHRLAPRLSPHKTWEGAVGGFVAGALVAGGGGWALNLDPPVVTAVALALVLPPAAEAGDLLESALKRRAAIKDFSHLLPGHGGLLDRLDSVLLVAPSLYWITQWLGT